MTNHQLIFMFRMGNRGFCISSSLNLFRTEWCLRVTSHSLPSANGTDVIDPRVGVGAISPIHWKIIILYLFSFLTNLFSNKKYLSHFFLQTYHESFIYPVCNTNIYRALVFFLNVFFALGNFLPKVGWIRFQFAIWHDFLLGGGNVEVEKGPVYKLLHLSLGWKKVVLNIDNWKMRPSQLDLKMNPRKWNAKW